jgi:hypothetical protein
MTCMSGTCWPRSCSSAGGYGKGMSDNVLPDFCKLCYIPGVLPVVDVQTDIDSAWPSIKDRWGGGIPLAIFNSMPCLHDELQAGRVQGGAGGVPAVTLHLQSSAQ